MGGYGGTIGAIASLLSAGTQIAGAAGAFTPSVPGAPKMPSPMDLLAQQQQQTKKQEQALIPAQTADWAARAGGGVSPAFLASMTGAAAGSPTGGLDVLDEIRKSLNVSP